jgi:chromosome segregation ATPase
MWTFDEESAKTYKKLEADYNRRVLSMTNNLQYVTKIGQAFNAHLDYVVEVRKLTKELLDSLNLPDRDEIAAIAKRVRALETRLDDLDEQIEESKNQMRNHQTQIKKFSQEMAELSKELVDSE